MSRRKKIQDILNAFVTKKILIVGDVMVDEYIWGEVGRISPEAPVPVVSCSEQEHRMGGAANVAINIKSLGADPLICSVIGRDQIGGEFKTLLAKRGMTDAGIVEADNRKTTVKTRIIGNHQQLLRVDHEHTAFLESDIESQLITRIEHILNETDIHSIIFQDYDKGVLTPLLIQSITSLANKKNIPILVDPKKRSFMRYKNVTLFKPNFKELAEGLNVSIDKGSPDSIFKAVLELHKENGIENIMVTLSELGVFISNGTEYKVIPAEVRDITDVSGAGDTVISVVALCMAANLDVFQSANLANLAGGLVCEKVGVIPVTTEMILKDNFDFPAEKSA